MKPLAWKAGLLLVSQIDALCALPQPYCVAQALFLLHCDSAIDCELGGSVLPHWHSVPSSIIV